MILTRSDIKQVDLDFEINQRIKAGRLDELLIIVPTNRKIRALKRELISGSPGGAAGRLNLETIGTFSTKILFAGGTGPGRVLSEASAAVLLKQSFQESELKYFSGYKREIPSGTLERIKNVISQYKRQGIAPSALRKEAESLPGSEKRKAEDIASIYEKFQAKCAELNVKETGDIYREVNSLETRNFRERFKQLYPEAVTIVVNGFDEFTDPEIEILNAASDAVDLRLFLAFDYYSYNPLIFSHLDKCYSKLLSKGFKETKDLSLGEHTKFVTSVRQKLFINTGRGKKEEYPGQIFKIEALNREKEIELIAKEIKELVLTKKAEPHRICVVFNLIRNYSPLVRDIFPLYGLPYNLTDRLSLDASQPIISIINLLEILENDFYYKNIFRALSGGYSGFKGVDASNLLKTSQALKIISGYENWRGTLSDAIARYDSIEDEDNSIVKVEKEAYEKALQDIESIYEQLSPFNKLMKISEFRKKLDDLIFETGMPSKLINIGKDSTEEKIKALITFTEVADEITELFTLEYGPDEKFPLKFYLNQMRTAVTSSRFNIKEKPGYGVQITTLSEIRGLKFDYLFIAGLCDGDLPTRFTPEIFFSGSFAKSEKNHQTEERYHFYQSLCSWEKALYLTSPVQEENKELVESNFMSEFSGLFQTAVKTGADFENTIYSKEEMLVHAGKEGVDFIESEYGDEAAGIDTGEVRRAAEAEAIRNSDPFGESEFTGRIGKSLSEDAKRELDDYRAKNYSISQLETYAKCPYKYFAERVLRLKPVEEPSEDIEAFELGSLLHGILYKFYTAIRKHGIKMFEATDEQFVFAEKLIFSIAEEAISEANFNSPLTFYEKEKITGIAGDKENSVLYRFLLAERENKDGYVPEFFEYGFGEIRNDDEAADRVRDIKAGAVNVRGKIDRIDMSGDGEKFKVVDYKLGGKKPNAEDLRQGLSLQLPLYMYAAKRIVKAKMMNDAEPSGAEIYSLKFKKDEFGKTLIKAFSSRKKIPAEEFDEIMIEHNRELMEISVKAIERYVEEIASGKFNLSMLKDRENKVCRFCSFKPVCRISEAD